MNLIYNSWLEIIVVLGLLSFQHFENLGHRLGQHLEQEQ